MGAGGGSARPRPLEQGACARAESSKTHEETNEEDEARAATPQKPLSPSAQPPEKGRLLLTRCPRGWGMESGRNYFASKPKRLLPCWQHMPLVGCLLELQAGLARSAVTQERSPGALARRNPEEASFYKLPVRRLHRGIGETRAWG